MWPTLSAPTFAFWPWFESAAHCLALPWPWPGCHFLVIELFKGIIKLIPKQWTNTWHMKTPLFLRLLDTFLGPNILRQVVQFLCFLFNFCQFLGPFPNAVKLLNLLPPPTPWSPLSARLHVWMTPSDANGTSQGAVGQLQNQRDQTSWFMKHMKTHKCQHQIHQLTPKGGSPCIFCFNGSMSHA